MVPDSEYDKVLRNYAWAILVLLYVAACDGAIKVHERAIIADFFKRRNPSIPFEAVKLDEIIKGFGRTPKSSFHQLVRERSGDSILLQDIFATALAIIASNPKTHTEQERAIEYLKKSWKGQIPI